MKFNLGLLLAILLALLSACSEKSSGKEEKIVSDTSNVVCHPSVHPFWSKFRAAVLKEDWEAVADMTEFPFDVSERSGAKVHLTREQYKKRLPEFLSQEPYFGYSGVNPKSKSMKALINDVPTLPKDACGDFTDRMNIDLWSFGMTPRGWRFGRVEIPGQQYRR